MNIHWLLRYRRKKLLHKLEMGKIDVTECIHRYILMTRSLSYSSADYRKRKPYNLYLKTTNIQKTLSAINLIDDILVNQLTSVDILLQPPKDTVYVALDDWLTDDHQIPYDEPDAWALLMGALVHPINTLIELKNTNSISYKYYYNTYIQSYLLDLLDIIDTMTSLVIGVTKDERRSIRTLIA